MRAITDTHKLPNHAMAAKRLNDNGFVSVNGALINKSNKWARVERLPSGKVLIKVGV